MSKSDDTPFEPLDIPRRELPADLTKRYRVYKSSDDFVTVEAASAAEALKASGVEKALRVQRDTVSLHNVIRLDGLKAEEKKPEETPAAAQAAIEAPAATQPGDPA